MTEMDTDQVKKNEKNNENKYEPLQDGVISEEELVTAFMRSEQLTTNFVNKIMTRFTSASASILCD